MRSRPPQQWWASREGDDLGLEPPNPRSAALQQQRRRFLRAQRSKPAAGGGQAAGAEVEDGRHEPPAGAPAGRPAAAAAEQGPRQQPAGSPPGGAAAEEGAQDKQPASGGEAGAAGAAGAAAAPDGGGRGPANDPGLGMGGWEAESLAQLEEEEAARQAAHMADPRQAHGPLQSASRGSPPAPLCMQVLFCGGPPLLQHPCLACTAPWQHRPPPSRTICC